MKKYFEDKKVAARVIAVCICAILFTSSVYIAPTNGKAVLAAPPLHEMSSSGEVDFWLTKGDESVKLEKQTTRLSFGRVANSNQFIDVDATKTFQSVDGFGYSLTGGSAYVINRLSATNKAKLLTELFGRAGNSIGISYLRISIGASDLNASVFSYDDIPEGQTDLSLTHFSLNADKEDLVPLLKKIVAINPKIKILATPWSPPVWMKDNGSSKGGSLQPRYFDVYAKYFVKYIRQMKAAGITIDAIAPQNEPLNPDNNPSLLMTAEQQLDFIKNNLGPTFRRQGIRTKIITYDHNCDHPEYPRIILDDAAARTYVDGSAFHLYNGEISALSQLHAAHPDKNLYFTEQWTSSAGKFADDLKWHVKNVIIGSMRNYSRIALEWNLANDTAFGPHTAGGCTQCKGALTIGETVKRNTSYYIIAHASKFVPPGSVRIGSNITGSLQNVAFKTPQGKKVLIVENDGGIDETFNIRYDNKWVTTSLAAGAVGTYVW